ncbi:MAG: O-antigen ligase family protein, partial [Rubrobacteraceae bacterium]
IKTSALFLALYLGRRIFLSTNVLALQFRIGASALCFALFAFGMPRGLLVSVAAAMILYAVFLSSPERAKLLIAAVPLSAIVLGAFWPNMRDFFVNTFFFDPSYQVRTETARTATQHFLEYPWFGFGQDSRQSTSFLELFGENFYPADIGILGVAFQFGIVGIVLYLAAVAWLCVGLIRLLWAYAERLDLAQRAFLWALFLMCLTFFMTTPLQARFIFGEGLFIGAFVWGLMMTHSHSLSTRPRATPRERPEPAVGATR